MKLSRKVKLLILILLSLSVFFIYKMTNYNNKNYTSLGDGLAKGVDCYGRIDYGYSDYIKEYLSEKNKLKAYTKDYAREDMTIEQLLNTILTDQKVKYKDTNSSIKNILRDTDYLTISIGLNDLLYKLSLTSEFSPENLDIIIKEIETSFNILIDEITKLYRHKIYVVGYYDLDPNNDFLKEAIRKLNKIYQKNDHVIYISTYIITENRSIFLPNPNSYYPNYKGYQVISNKIIDKISKKLEK